MWHHCFHSVRVVRLFGLCCFHSGHFSLPVCYHGTHRVLLYWPSWLFGWPNEQEHTQSLLKYKHRATYLSDHQHLLRSKGSQLWDDVQPTPIAHYQMKTQKSGRIETQWHWASIGRTIQIQCYLGLTEDWEDQSQGVMTGCSCPDKVLSTLDTRQTTGGHSLAIPINYWTDSESDWAPNHSLS